MNRMTLLTVGLLVLGAGCYALTRQHKTVTAKPPLVKSVIKDSVSGQANAQAWMKTLKRVQPLIQQGKEATAQKRYVQAESLFQQALKIQSQDALVWLLLADVYERQGKQAKALEAYRALIYPKNWGGSIRSDITTHMRFVLALCGNNEYSEAAEVFNKAMDDSALESVPDQVLMNARRTGDNTPLVPYVKEHSLLPMRFDPNNPDENQLQAAAHLILGTKQPSYGPISREEQMKHLQAAERFASHWGRVYSALADALEQQGRKQEAQTAQSRALALGDHSSLKERLIRGEDENMRKHQLWYNPDHPEYYHYHDPNMQPLKAEVDAALSELKQRGKNPPSASTSNNP